MSSDRNWKSDIDPSDFEALAHSIAKYLGRKITMDMIGLQRTCVLCQNWNPDSEVCKLVNARPPATVIAFGCERFER